MSGRPPQPAAPLLPQRARRPAFLLLAACIVVIAAAGAVAAGNAHGNALDRPIDSWLQGRLAGELGVLRVLGDVGEIVPAAVLTPLLVLACLRIRWFSGAALAGITVLVAAGMTQVVLKPLVHETIDGYLSFPSGHTTSVFSFTAALAVLLLNPPSRWPSPRWRVLTIAILALAGCVVGAAMIGLDYHYFTDTVVGAAVGTASALATAFLLDLPPVLDRLGRLTVAIRWPRSPRAPPE